jgi:hypothetical protein
MSTDFERRRSARLAWSESVRSIRLTELVRTGELVLLVPEANCIGLALRGVVGELDPIASNAEKSNARSNSGNWRRLSD